MEGEGDPNSLNTTLVTRKHVFEIPVLVNHVSLDVYRLFKKTYRHFHAKERKAMNLEF